MIIIGIDPGYAIVGVGVVEYKGNKFRPIEYCDNHNRVYGNEPET